MKMTESERKMWEAARDNPWRVPRSTREETVIPTLETRRRYIQFASEAAMLCREKKPVNFSGEHWKL